MGIRAVITSSSDEKLARAKALGAALGINYQTTPEWEKAALDFTGGTGVDHVVEVGGAATLTRSFGAIRVGGKVTLIGGLSGGATELNPGLIFARRANVQGISVGSTEMFEAMNRAVADNRDQARGRQGISLRRGSSGLPAHGLRCAFRQDRHSDCVMAHGGRLRVLCGQLRCGRRSLQRYSHRSAYWRLPAVAESLVAGTAGVAREGQRAKWRCVEGHAIGGRSQRF